jgi:hypothetical protein
MLLTVQPIEEKVADEQEIDQAEFENDDPKEQLLPT